MTTDAATHVILGSGQIGSLLRDALLAKGHRVRVVRRAATTPAESPGLSFMSGDMRDLSFAEEAIAGAQVVYDCMNPAYHQWAEQLLPLGRASLHGASKANAKLVALDCLYMYGMPDGALREDSPRRPCSRKGALRLELEELRMNADARGHVRVAVGRASDFIGPNLSSAFWSARFFSRILAGKKGETMGNPDLAHSYTDVNDVVRGLITLGDEPKASGHVWHLPTAAAISSREIATRFGEELGVRAEIQPFPIWQLRMLGVFMPFMSELIEMNYQWLVPYVLDDSRFRETFGYGATPLQDTIRRTADWAKSQLGRRTSTKR